jgi:hypothetical protein
VAVLLLSIALAAGLHLADQGVRVVGAVPQGMPPLTLPSVSAGSWALAQALWVPALLISLVGFVESVSVGQSLAAKRRERIDPDAELRALGLSNLGAGLSGGFPVTGGFSRSVVNFDAGARTPAAGIFTAVGLALACGLRLGEIEKARWAWWQTSNGRPLLADGSVNVKNHSGALAVRPLDPFWTILNRTIDRHGWRSDPAEYCLAGDCASDREFWCQHVLSKWLRWLGWRTQKAAHALRDLSASYVTMKFGLDRARIFCRHGQVATTAVHYSTFIDEDMMDMLDVTENLDAFHDGDQMPELVSDGNGSSPPSEGGGSSGGYGGGGLPRQQA